MLNRLFSHTEVKKQHEAVFSKPVMLMKGFVLLTVNEAVIADVLHEIKILSLRREPIGLLCGRPKTTNFPNFKVGENFQVFV